MKNKYAIAALVLILAVLASYMINFYIFLDQKVSTDTAVWGQFGDYTGGLLNPVLSFIALILLIKSLTLQNEANISLRHELKNTQRTEKLRSFESIFFSMIKSQRELFQLFKITTTVDGAEITKYSADAVIEIENEIEVLRENNCSSQDIIDYIDSIDEQDQIFGLARAFYISVKMASEKLSDEEGFTTAERKAHFLTLINFTDFSQLRLILIAVQFMNYHSAEYLKSHQEFGRVLEDVGLDFHSH